MKSLRRGLIAAALGAAAAYFLDPNLGRRRRATLVQRGGSKLRRLVRKGERAARHQASDAFGMAQRAMHPVSSQAPPPDDAELAHKVETLLFRDPEVPKGSININAERGVVYLRGKVDSTERIHQLEERTEAIPGVRGVETLLSVDGEG